MLSPANSDVGEIRGHVNLVQEAHKQRAVLVERLRVAHGAQDLLAKVDKDAAGVDVGFADVHLELWLAVRDWLHRRLPAQVAEVDDPREALLRLRDQLAVLEERLARQEDDLRGASEDVARGIDVQIRKARGQVSRLNQNLGGVSFGSIEGIRVKVQSVERMEQVLRALREGAVQGLLFQENLPIEEALDEIFRRYGGGRTGGQRLLDYREYVHLQVEVRRTAGSDWEIANPTRLSTGEAIGVGAALMMVVLTEWERDTNLLRGKRAHGSLRFLFLDEANRLSHDNLGSSSTCARRSTCSCSSPHQKLPERTATRPIVWYDASTQTGAKRCSSAGGERGSRRDLGERQHTPSVIGTALAWQAQAPTHSVGGVRRPRRASLDTGDRSPLLFPALSRGSTS